MAKEFKNYDKKYSRLMNTRLFGEPILPGLDHWPHMSALVKPSAADVARVVYESGVESERWQMFRVSLKGWGTLTKLSRLNHRWVGHVLESGDMDEMMRLNNYIDSMKRSGLIDLEGKMIK